MRVPRVWVLKLKVAVFPEGMVWVVLPVAVRVKSVAVGIAMVKLAGLDVLGWKLESPA